MPTQDQYSWLPKINKFTNFKPISPLKHHLILIN